MNVVAHTPEDMRKTSATPRRIAPSSAALALILYMLYIPITLLAEGRHSRGVLMVEQAGGGAGDSAQNSSGSRRPAIPGLVLVRRPRENAAAGRREARRPTSLAGDLRALPEDRSARETDHGVRRFRTSAYRR